MPADGPTESPRRSPLASYEHRDADAPEVVYLDHAATSYPKHPGVAPAMAEALVHVGGNSGRGAHRLATAAADRLARLRGTLARLVGAPDPSRLVLTASCTDAANMAIRSVAERVAGSERNCVLISTFEHNAVARPAHAFAKAGLVRLDVAAPDAGEFVLDPDDVLARCDERTALVCLTHASNVTGAVQPVAEVAAGLRERSPEALLLVDAAQTAGLLGLDASALGADVLIFGGHKHLRGPTGVAAMALSERVAAADAPLAVTPTRFGGTGGSDDGLDMPTSLPQRLEPGSPNVTAAAGLLAALEGLTPEELGRRRRLDLELTARLIEGFAQLPGVEMLGPPAGEGRIGVVSVAIGTLSPADAAAALDASFSIAARPGLHCSPLAHRHLATTPHGALRFSLGETTTADEIDAALAAVATLTTMPTLL